MKATTTDTILSVILGAAIGILILAAIDKIAPDTTSNRATPITCASEAMGELEATIIQKKRGIIILQCSIRESKYGKATARKI